MTVAFEAEGNGGNRSALGGGANDLPATPTTRRGLIRAAVGGAAVAAGVTRLAMMPETALAVRKEDVCDPGDPSCENWYGAGRPPGRTGCILLSANQRGNAPGRFGASPATAAPVLAGLPWFEAFDYPVRRGASWWIGTGTNWGGVRAGHAVCLRPPSMPDPDGAWEFYDQGASYGCVGFATSRMCSLFNGRFYNGTEMYDAAKLYDRWAGNRYDGTSIDGGMEAALQVGAWRVANLKTSGPFKSDGIKSWAWLDTADDVLLALGSKEGFVRILNSWGIGYPREVRLSVTALRRMILTEGGQFTVAVDRPTGGL